MHLQPAERSERVSARTRPRPRPPPPPSVWYSGGGVQCSVAQQVSLPFSRGLTTKASVRRLKWRLKRVSSMGKSDCGASLSSLSLSLKRVSVQKFSSAPGQAGRKAASGRDPKAETLFFLEKNPLIVVRPSVHTVHLTPAAVSRLPRARGRESRSTG